MVVVVAVVVVVVAVVAVVVAVVVVVVSQCAGVVDKGDDQNSMVGGDTEDWAGAAQGHCSDAGLD